MNEYIHIAGLLYIIKHVQKGLAKTVEQVLRSGVARCVIVSLLLPKHQKKPNNNKNPNKGSNLYF